MTRAAAAVVEQTRRVTPLGLALHDLATDVRVVEGLRVDARPLEGGRVTTAFQTRSGVYAFRGLHGMRRIELPPSDSLEMPSPPNGTEFLISVTDTRARFVAMVLRVSVPTAGLVTQGMLMQADASHSGRVESPPADDLPVYLFSSSSRVLPAHLGAVRGQLVDAASGKPAAHGRLDVVVNPGLVDSRRAIGIADSTGAVVVPMPYPRFGPVDDRSSPPTGGVPPAGQTWPVEIRAFYEPDVLDHRPRLPAPALNGGRGGVLAQAQAVVWPTAHEADMTLRADLQFGSDLIVRTAGDERSRLLIGGTSP